MSRCSAELMLINRLGLAESWFSAAVCKLLESSGELKILFVLADDITLPLIMPLFEPA